MMLGRIDEVDGDYVATRFVGLLLPTDCMYIAQAGTRTTRGSGGDSSVRIKKDWRSVALGCVRLWGPILAVGIPVLHVAPAGVSWGVSVALLVLFVASFSYGRLPDDEKARLRLLGTVTGLRVDPNRLLQSTRDVKRELLGQLMVRAGIPVTPDGILSVLDDIPVPAMPLVYGYARYAGDDDAWRECASTVYARYLLSET
jgi:hypothetical protein